MKRVFSLLLSLLFLITLAACNNDLQPATTQAITPAVGICLPNEQTHWLTDCQALTSGLEAIGYDVLAEYAQGDSSLQTSQVEALIDQKVKCLIIAPVDPLSLTNVLQHAKEENIPVIALDRMIMHTDWVSAYVGFDYNAIGVCVGQALVTACQLASAPEEEKSYTIEFFINEPENNNAFAYYQGLFSVLQPYLDNGVLLCNSGRTSFEDVCMQETTVDFSKERCETYLSKYYKEALPDILCTSSDILANGCIEGLLAKKASPKKTWPLISGLGTDTESLENLVSGYQALTVHLPSEALIPHCLQAAQHILAGEETPFSSQTYHNGQISVPAVLQGASVIDAANYQSLLIDTGIFSFETPAEEE